MSDTDLTPGGSPAEEGQPLTEWPLPSGGVDPDLDIPPAPESAPAAETVPPTEGCPGAASSPDPETAPVGFYGGSVTPPEPPKRDKKKLKRGVAIAAAVLLVVAAAAVFAFPAILRAVNPKAYVAGCMAKTMAGYAPGDAAAVTAALKDKPTRQTLSFHLGEISEDTAREFAGSLGISPADVPGTGIEYIIELDRENRQAALEVPVYLGRSPLASLVVMLEDDKLSFGSDQFTAGDYYFIHTETLGADILASPLFGPDSPVDSAFGFNFFELSDTTQTASSLDDETVAELARLSAELNETITVANAGSAAAQSVTREFSATRYTMTVPVGTLRGFLSDAMRVLIQDEFFSYVTDDSYFNLDEYMDSFDRGLAFLTKDVFIDFYIAGNRVVLLEALLPTEDRGRPAEIRLKLEFDSGKALVATLTCAESGGVPFGLVCSYTLDGDRFGLNVVSTGGDGAGPQFYASGTFTADRSAKRVALDFSELTIQTAEEKLSLSGGYSIESLGGFTRPFPQESIPFLEMDSEGYYELIAKINAGVNSIDQSIRTAGTAGGVYY